MSENPQVYPFKRQEEASDLAYAPLHAPGKKIWQAVTQFNVQVVFFIAAAFLFSRAQLLGGLYPFGPAFIGAVATLYRRQGFLIALPVLAGYYTIVSGMEFYPYLAICVLLAIIFFFYQVDSHKQWMLTPLLVGCTVLICKGLFLVFYGATGYELTVALFESLFAAALSIVFLVVLGGLRRLDFNRHFNPDETVCCFVALLGLVSGFGTWSIAGIGMNQVASCLVILLAALLGGAGTGAGIGALVGVAPSLSALVAPSVIGTYAFCGLLAGAFRTFGRIGTAIGFILGNLILSLYLFSQTQITQAILASVAAAFLFFLVPNKYVVQLERIFSPRSLKSSREEKEQRLLRLSARKLRNAGLVFKDLALSLQELSQDDKEPLEESVNTVLNHLSRRICADCSVRDICWKIDFSDTYRGVMGLFKAAEEHGAAAMNDVPENFKKRCPHMKELLATINCLYEMYCQNNYWQAQRQSSRSLLASQLQGSAQVLEGLARDLGVGNPDRDILEKELGLSLARRGLPVESIAVNHCKDKMVSVCVNFNHCPGEGMCREGVTREISRLLGREFRLQELTCSTGCTENCRYTLLEEGAHQLAVAKAQLAKDGKGICGDCGGTVLLESGLQLMMISDGMGAGATAAREANAALSMLSRLLETGFTRDTAIDTVNAAMALRSPSETFVTLDLCMVNLYNGQAEFVKTGAAPSFMKRGNEVKVIEGRSLPVGMLTAVEKEVIEEQIQVGDMIVMASDGLLDVGNKTDTEWLASVLAQYQGQDPQGLAEYLLHRAVDISGGRLRDDITVLAVQMTA